MLFTASKPISRSANIRVATHTYLSFLVVSMLKPFGRSQCDGDVNENAMLVVMAGVLIQEIVVGDNDEGNEGGMLPVAMATILAADGDGDIDMRVISW